MCVVNSSHSGALSSSDKNHMTVAGPISPYLSGQIDCASLQSAGYLAGYLDCAIGRISCRIELADSGFNFYHANLVLATGVNYKIGTIISILCAFDLLHSVHAFSSLNGWVFTSLSGRVLTTHRDLVQSLCLHCAPLAQY